MRQTAFLLIFFLLGCSPQRQLKRLQNKYPFLFETKIRDSISVKRIKAFDTVLLFSHSQKDSFFLEKSKTQIFRFNDTIWVNQKFDPCTTFVKNIVYKFPEKKDKKTDKYFWFFLIFFLVLIAFLYGRIFGNR